ncbi:hypothetical protein ACN6Q3_06915, partial [Acinetobacter baumannii]
MIKKLGILALFSLTTSLSFANVDTVRELSLIHISEPTRRTPLSGMA